MWEGVVDLRLAGSRHLDSLPSQGSSDGIICIVSILL